MKTDEAKRLHEQIGEIYWECDRADDSIDKIINKVLDVAIESIARTYVEQELSGPFTINVEAINKLRP